MGCRVPCLKGFQPPRAVGEHRQHRGSWFGNVHILGVKCFRGYPRVSVAMTARSLPWGPGRGECEGVLRSLALHWNGQCPLACAPLAW